MWVPRRQTNTATASPSFPHSQAFHAFPAFKTECVVSQCHAAFIDCLFEQSLQVPASQRKCHLSCAVEFSLHGYSAAPAPTGSRIGTACADRFRLTETSACCAGKGALPCRSPTAKQEYIIYGVQTGWATKCRDYDTRAVTATQFTRNIRPFCSKAQSENCCPHCRQVFTGC